MAEFVIRGGSCSRSGALDYVDYIAAGYTASGAPYYRDVSSSHYVYWDPDCDGDPMGALPVGVTVGRVGSSLPSSSAPREPAAGDPNESS